MKIRKKNFKKLLKCKEKKQENYLVFAVPLLDILQEKLKEKYFNGALKDIENAIELNPRIVACYFIKGEIYYSIHNGRKRVNFEIFIHNTQSEYIQKHI